MQIFPFDPTLIGTGRIFPPAIESIDWIGYHATSSYYASDIESGGFLSKKPLPVADLERLVEIGLKYREEVSEVQGFIELASLSFAPLSEMALFYTRPESHGGQGLLHVTRLIEVIIEKDAKQLDPAETDKLTALQGHIALIRAELPVIYAVNLSGLKRITYGKFTSAVHVYEKVPAERLLGKMIIDQPVNYTTIDTKTHTQALRNILSSPGAHYIKQIAS
jgi:hypothetical protein